MEQAHPDIDATKKGVEVDSNGTPYYRWPPFPEPPEGSNIIPFSEFKPLGIQVPLGDEVEVDGLGIPTVRLAVTHDNEAPPRKKKKIKKAVTGEEILQRSVWWEEWEAGEAQRIRSAKIYDQLFHSKERVTRAVEEFREVHDWGLVSSRLTEWYQKFMYFLGLNDISLRPRFVRQQEAQPTEDDVSDGDDDANTREAAKPQPLKVEAFDEKRHAFRQKPFIEPDEFLRQKLERIREAQECRLEAFIDNPHLAIKIFFSSYFRDSGMMWEKMALRDAPRITEFFLNYVLQTRALCEEEASLKLALEVARKAKDELPMTKAIGVKMPDELACCLTTIYGSRLKKAEWPTEVNIDWNDERDAEFRAEVQQAGGEVISDIAPRPVSPTNNSTADVGTTQADEATGGWGSIGADAAGGWGSAKLGDLEDNPWAQPKANTWPEPEVHSLMALLGPTSLHLTHTVGYVEDSTRYISSVILPEQAGDKASTFNDLFRTFARVELKPYPSFAAPSAPRAAIQPPELLEDPWAGIPSDGTEEDIEKPKIPRHDPTKDTITLLVDPELGKLLTSCKRMGLGGTFVQIVPDHSATTPVSSPNHGKEQGGKHGSRGHGRGSESEDTFWYAEKILQIIPSFWTEKQI